MKKLALIFLTLATVGYSTDVSIWNSGLALEGQGYSLYTGADAPAGAYQITMGSGVTTKSVDIALGQTLPAGGYRVFIWCIDYDAANTFQATLDGVTSSAVELDDRDTATGYWSTVATVTTTGSEDTLTLTLNKTVSSSTTVNPLLQAIFITDEANVIVTRYDLVVDYTYPSAGDYDNSAAIPGNVYPDGGFETKANMGRWVYANAYNWRPVFDETQYHSGAVSLRMPAGLVQGIYSRPIRLKPNKNYYLSAWVKSSVNAAATLRIINAITPPSEFTAIQDESDSISTTTTWQRISLTARMLKYPDSEFFVVLAGQEVGGGGGYIYWDDVQLEEGSTLNDFAQRPVELGLLTSVESNIFLDTDTLAVKANVYNSTGSAYSGNVVWEVYNFRNELVDSGSDAVTSLADGSLATVTLGLTMTDLGYFRVNAWLDNQDNIQDELSFSVIDAPPTGADTTSKVGTHSNLYDWQTEKLKRRGMKWSRQLSPGVIGRWSIDEASDDSFIYYDTEVATAVADNIELLIPLGESVPSWAQRTYFTLSGVSGAGYSVGETVSNGSGASGTVAVVLTSSNITGDALQLSGVTGSFASGNTVTGASSSTTGTISSTPLAGTPDLTEFNEFCTTLVNHYKASVSYWEVWNEPNQKAEFGSDMTFYSELLEQATAAIIAEDATAQVIGLGGVASAAQIVEVLNNVSATTKNNLAAVSIHLYADGSTEPGATSEAETVKTGVIDAYSIDVWNTESGVWDFGGYGGLNSNFVPLGRPLRNYRGNDFLTVSYQVGLVALARNIIGSLGHGLGKFFYYDGRQTTVHESSNTTDLELDGTIKPKAVMVTALTQMLNGADGLGKYTMTNAETEAIAFDATSPLVALYSDDGNQYTLDLSGFSAATITVYDVMGNPTSVPSKIVSYGRMPVFVSCAGATTGQTQTAFEAATSSLVTDVTEPVVALTLVDRGTLTWPRNVEARWYAIDSVSVGQDTDPQAIDYRYRLLGYDDWSDWGGVSHAEYYSVPASSSYIMQVESRDAAGNVGSASAYLTPPGVRRSPSRAARTGALPFLP